MGHYTKSENFLKISPVYSMIFSWKHQFLSYHSKYSQMNSIISGVTWCRGIIGAVNAHIDVTILHSIAEYQCDKWRWSSGVGDFATKLVAIATSLKTSETEGQIDHLQFNIYHIVHRLWKSVQQILGNSALSEKVRSNFRQFAPKIGYYSSVPWAIENVYQTNHLHSFLYQWWKFRKDRSTILWDNGLIRAWLVCFLRHKIGCCGNVTWEIGK